MDTSMNQRDSFARFEMGYCYACGAGVRMDEFKAIIMAAKTWLLRQTGENLGHLMSHLAEKSEVFPLVSFASSRNMLFF